MAAVGKTLGDSFENLTSSVAGAVKPVVDEASKIVDTAKQQLAGETGANEQGQQGGKMSPAQIAQLKQQDEAQSQAKAAKIKSALFGKMTQPAPKVKTVQEEKEEEKKVKQFKLMEENEKKKKLQPLAASRAATAAERKQGGGG